MIDFLQSFIERRTLVIGHRGAPRVKHENTLESFQAAIDIGAHAVEFDVRRTADNVIVVIHDAVVAPDFKRVDSLTYEELDYAASQQGFHVPTISEALDFCAGRIALDIELKEPGYEAEVLELVGRFCEPAHAIFKSFDPSSVTALKHANDRFMAGLLVGLPSPKVLVKNRGKLRIARRVEHTGADFIAPHWRLARPRFLRRMAKRQIPVVVWTVDSKRFARFLLKQRAAGIVTNRPEKILATQKSLESQ